MKLEDIGNFDYSPKPRVIQPRGVVYVPKIAAVKFYIMYKVENRYSKDESRYLIESNLEDVKSQLENKLKRKSIPSRSGLGYAILSENTFNVSMWGCNSSDAHIGFQKLFSIKGTPAKIDPLNIRIAGSFCSWELEISRHEAIAWRRFLYSERTEEDKNRYLSDFYKRNPNDLNKFLEVPIEEILVWQGHGEKTTTRLRNLFESMSIRTVRQLLEYSEQDLLEQRNIGPTCIEYLRCKLDEFGLELKE